jgi:primosomal protein N' (replication factor Y)
MTGIPSEASCAASDKLYADVIIPRHLTGPFTYLVPRHLTSVLCIGHRVEVPFGHSHVQGAVTALMDRLPNGVDRNRLKEIRALVADSGSRKIPDPLLDLARRVAEDYVAPWGQCLRLVMPPAIPRLTGAGRFKLTELGRTALATDESLSGDVRLILKRLSRKPAGIKRATLAGSSRTTRHPSLDALIEKGWIIIVEEHRLASTMEKIETPRVAQSGGHSLNAMEARPFPAIPEEWEERLIGALATQRSERLVLQASLKYRMACLHRAIHHIVGRGLTVLVIVGEAERAEWVAGTIVRATTIPSACFHSGLPDGEKAMIWQQASRLQVVVGTRSAVFFPLTKVGMIWVERDEDPALKEPQEPRYHARDVAWTRARDERALLIVSSVHPSLETVATAEPCGTVLRQDSTVEQGPRIEVVDLRRQSRNSVLSPSLFEAIGESIRHQRGALLFLNRKGYAGALICRDCGEVPRCGSCRVALTYSRQRDRLSCAYCGTAGATPDTCASCAGRHLQLVGEGTERVEDEVRRQFPHAKVIRADGDTMGRTAQADALWQQIKKREWDVLIGTQLLLRDYAVPPVGVVGIVQADASLNLPDFRAAERTYHQLLDAVELARPQAEGGHVIIQTYLPSHHAIQAVVQRDEGIFRLEELSHRTALGYPPAVHLIALHVSGTDSKLVEKASGAWVTLLTSGPCIPGSEKDLVRQGESEGRSNQLSVLGPVPSPVPKLRGRTRLQILVKSLVREEGIRAVRATVSRLERAYPARAVKFDIDVDPIEMW